jgi:hypothetical protein
MIKEVDQIQPHWQQVERDRSLQRRRHKFSYLKSSKSKSPDDSDADSNAADQDASQGRVDLRV